MNQASEAGGDQAKSSFAALKRFTRPRVQVEQCDLCSQQIGPQHDHLVDPVTRQLLCACEACGILFSSQGDTKYKRVPRRSRYLPDFSMDDATWDELMVPVGMAFFFRSSVEERVMAFYPSPAGPTESLLTFEAWQEVVRDNPLLNTMEPDVEALLVWRVTEPAEYYLAPVDKCYELVGLIRANWRGLSGGAEVWKEIRDFFAHLKARSTVVAAPQTAPAGEEAPAQREGNA